MKVICAGKKCSRVLDTNKDIWYYISKGNSGKDLEVVCSRCYSNLINGGVKNERLLERRNW
jgi:hypothetical protein